MIDKIANNEKYCDILGYAQVVMMVLNIFFSIVLAGTHIVISFIVMLISVTLAVLFLLVNSRKEKETN